ncbi:MAG TPA: hypothetical protein VGO56_22375 [Pyrinomonadaceae bacterium]|nr:hypothetical protein [Pyrinomonadaceae bacterium]
MSFPFQGWDHVAAETGRRVCDTMKVNLSKFIPSRRDGRCWVNYCFLGLKGRAKFISTLRVDVLLSTATIKTKPVMDKDAWLCF